jgi:photosystem II stability/assembly factor-like uncharacterized protein
VLALGLDPAAASEGAVAVWSPLGPPSGAVCSLVQAPSDPQRRYALVPQPSSTGALFRSEDDGASWVRATPPTSGGLWCALAVDPAAADRLFVAGYEWSDLGPAMLVHASSDGGRSWEVVARPPQAQSFISSLAALRLDGRLVLLLAETSQVLRSDDEGASWTVVAGLPGAYHTVRGLTADPFSPRVVYAAVEQGGIYASRDGGRSFARSSAGIVRPWQTSLHGVAVDRARAGRLWAYGGAVGALLYRSEDHGCSWRAVGAPLGRLRVVTSVQALEGGTVFARAEGSTPRLLRSLDGGDHFAVLPVALPRATSLSTLGGELAAHGSGGIFRSTNGGRSWRRSMDGLEAGEVLAHASASSSPELQWATIAGWQGVARTLDGGRTWSETAQETFARLRIDGLVAVPGRPAEVVALVSRQVPNAPLGVLDGALASSLDRGRRFTVGSFDSCRIPRRLVIDPVDPDRRLLLLAPSSHFCGSTACLLRRSTDSGANFDCLDSLEVDHGFGDLAVATDGTLYASRVGDQPGIWRSDDGGDHWSEQGPEKVDALLVAPWSASELWARAIWRDGAWQGPARSRDGGHQWEVLALPLATPWTVFHLAFAAERPGTLAVATPTDLLVSTDHGQSFVPLAPPPGAMGRFYVKGLAWAGNTLRVATWEGVWAVDLVAPGPGEPSRRGR